MTGNTAQLNPAKHKPAGSIRSPDREDTKTARHGMGRWPLGQKKEQDVFPKPSIHQSPYNTKNMDIRECYLWKIIWVQKLAIPPEEWSHFHTLCKISHVSILQSYNRFFSCTFLCCNCCLALGKLMSNISHRFVLLSNKIYIYMYTHFLPCFPLVKLQEFLI